MPFKKFNPCQPCCDDVCEIGFYGQIIDEVVDAFPNANGNAFVDEDNINQQVWGEAGNKPLDIFYFGYPFGMDSCRPLTIDFESNTDFLYELNQFMKTHGGKILAVAENTAPVPELSVGCFEDEDVDLFNDILTALTSSIRIAYDTSLDFGCQAGYNIVTSNNDPLFQGILDDLMDGVTQINLGGTTEVTHVTGLSLFMSNDDDTKAVMALELLGAGCVLCCGDSNLFDSCIEGGSFNWGEEREDGNFRTFLGNFCNLTWSYS